MWALQGPGWMWARKWFLVTPSWLPSLNVSYVQSCGHNLFSLLSLFSSIPFLELLLLMTVVFGSQCLAAGWIFLTRLLILSIYSFFSFCLWFFPCMCAHMFKSLNKDLSFPSVKNSWHCETFLPVGARICCCILGEAVKLHWFSFLLKKEGKVAMDIQMIRVGFLSSFRSLHVWLFAFSDLLSTLPELVWLKL